MRGPQVGIGMLPVADRWLERAGALLGENPAAAMPATTTERAKMRMTSFMVSNPFSKLIDREGILPNTKMLVQFFQLNPSFSYRSI
jgi:hypothetical protein